MRLIQRLGTGVMVTLALAIQPVQYGLLAGLGHAYAQNDPCNPAAASLPVSPPAAGQLKAQDLCGDTTTVAPSSAISSVTVTPSTLTLSLGASQGLSSYVKGNGVYNTRVNWSSSNAGVVSVDSSGTVTALSSGTAQITARSAQNPSVTGSTSVTVPSATPVGNLAVSVLPTRAILNPGNTEPLSVTVSGTGNFNNVVSWSSSNPGVATVSAKGLITAVAPGTAAITATSLQNPAVAASMTVTVTTGALNQVKYMLLPGIGDGDRNVNDDQSDYFADTRLQNFLDSSNNPTTGTNVSVARPWNEWHATGLAAQGTDLASKLNAAAASNTKIILIAHSMGGLRGRQALQFNSTNYPAMASSVKALVTMGTPNLGAPVIENAKPAATLLGGVFGTAVVGFTPAVGTFDGYGPFIGGVLGMFGARAWAANIVDSESGKDMKPTSAFISDLNSSAAPKIPSHVVTVSISGLNSNIDSYGASYGLTTPFTQTLGSTAAVQNVRVGVASYFTVAGALMIAAGFFTSGLTVPFGLALLAAATLLFTLPAFWRSNVMGSTDGDAIVPKDSQPVPAGAGGDRSLGDLTLNAAMHTGRFGEYQAQSTGEYVDNLNLQTMLKAVQDRVGVPRSGN